MDRILVTAKNRLLQFAGELISEGYRITGRLGDEVIALKHTNGNRITLIASVRGVAFIKNGHFIKSEPVVIKSAESSD